LLYDSTYEPVAYSGKTGSKGLPWVFRDKQPLALVQRSEAGTTAHTKSTLHRMKAKSDSWPLSERPQGETYKAKMMPYVWGVSENVALDLEAALQPHIRKFAISTSYKTQKNLREQV
jgi:hypothetical protein